MKLRRRRSLDHSWEGLLSRLGTGADAGKTGGDPSEPVVNLAFSGGTAAAVGRLPARPERRLHELGPREARRPSGSTWRWSTTAAGPPCTSTRRSCSATRRRRSNGLATAGAAVAARARTTTTELDRADLRRPHRRTPHRRPRPPPNTSSTPKLNAREPHFVHDVSGSAAENRSGGAQSAALGGAEGGGEAAPGWGRRRGQWGRWVRMRSAWAGSRAISAGVRVGLRRARGEGGGQAGGWGRSSWRGRSTALPGADRTARRRPGRGRPGRR